MATGPDPKGKRALFETVVTDRDPMAGDGASALFSNEPPEPAGAVIHCSRCRQHTRVSLLDAGRRILTFSVWLPLRANSRWLTCPACRHRAWCRVSLS